MLDKQTGKGREGKDMQTACYLIELLYCTIQSTLHFPEMSSFTAPHCHEPGLVTLLSFSLDTQQPLAWNVKHF